MVIIVGTSHSIQMGIDDATDLGGHNFEAFIRDLCKAHAIRAVAEEMNPDALAERSCTTSVLSRLANALGLEHRFCDPNRSERFRLGILQENDIRAQAFFSRRSEPEIMACVTESHTKREVLAPATSQPRQMASPIYLWGRP